MVEMVDHGKPWQIDDLGSISTQYITTHGY